MIALIPFWTNVSIPSTNGKNASDAPMIISFSLIFWNLFIFSIAILQLSNLLGWPDPIPTVELFLVKTIALDFTFRHTLKANIRSYKIFFVGLILETTSKLSLEKNDNDDMDAVISCAALKYFINKQIGFSSKFESKELSRARKFEGWIYGVH